MDISDDEVVVQASMQPTLYMGSITFLSFNMKTSEKCWRLGSSIISYPLHEGDHLLHARVQYSGTNLISVI